MVNAVVPVLGHRQEMASVTRPYNHHLPPMARPLFIASSKFYVTAVSLSYSSCKDMRDKSLIGNSFTTTYTIIRQSLDRLITAVRLRISQRQARKTHQKPSHQPPQSWVKSTVPSLVLEKSNRKHQRSSLKRRRRHPRVGRRRE